MKRSLLSACASFLVFTAVADASIVVTLGQSGSDTVISYTGSLRVNELTVDENIGGQGYYIDPVSGSITFNGNSYADNLTYACTWTSGSQGFGSGPFRWANTTSGDLLLVALSRNNGLESWVGLTRTYTSGSSISGNDVFTGMDYAALGIDPTAFNSVYTFANGETITLTSTVPEPATCALFGGAGALLAAVFLRKRSR